MCSKTLCGWRKKGDRQSNWGVTTLPHRCLHRHSLHPYTTSLAQVEAATVPTQGPKALPDTPPSTTTHETGGHSGTLSAPPVRFCLTGSVGLALCWHPHAKGQPPRDSGKPMGRGKRSSQDQLGGGTGRRDEARDRWVVCSRRCSCLVKFLYKKLWSASLPW